LGVITPIDKRGFLVSSLLLFFVVVKKNTRMGLIELNIRKIKHDKEWID